MRCCWKPSKRKAIYFPQFDGWVLESERWDGRSSEDKGDRNVVLISMSRKIGRWSDEVMEWKGRIAPRCRAGKKD